MDFDDPRVVVDKAKPVQALAYAERLASAVASSAADRRRDPHDADPIAQIATELRARLLAIHRGRLSREDLEDAYSQATLELLVRAKRAPFQGPAHIRNALNQKVTSRVCDRRAHAAGRSPLGHAEATAVRIDDHVTLPSAAESDPAERGSPARNSSE